MNYNLHDFVATREELPLTEGFYVVAILHRYRQSQGLPPFKVHTITTSSGLAQGAWRDLQVMECDGLRDAYLFRRQYGNIERWDGSRWVRDE